MLYATTAGAKLKELVKSGVILFFGNNESPMNYPNNTYYPFRQDSSFLYYFGQHRDGLVGVIDVDNDREILIGNDIDIEDIVWYGSVDSVSNLASEVGVSNSAPMKELKVICDEATRTGWNTGHRRLLQQQWNQVRRCKQDWCRPPGRC